MTIDRSKMSGPPPLTTLVASALLSSVAPACEETLDHTETAERASLDLAQAAPVATVAARVRGATATGTLCSKLLDNVTSSSGDTLNVMVNQTLESEAGAAKSAKCAIAVDLQVPRGMQVQGTRVVWQGFGVGRSMKANVQANLYYAGTTAPAPQTLFAQRLDKNLETWAASQVLDAWSPCADASGVVTLKTEVTADVLPDPGGKDAVGVVGLNGFALSLLSDTHVVTLRACTASR